jgi:hypothetical protein
MIPCLAKMLTQHFDAVTSWLISFSSEPARCRHSQVLPGTAYATANACVIFLTYPFSRSA